MAPPLQDLASLLLCPGCRSQSWRVTGTSEDGHLECPACGNRYACAEGVLDLGSLHEDRAVALEREGVRRTEHDPALGGINEAFADLARAEGALKLAILSLPHGDGSGYYREPGYFSNVLASVPAFEFLLANLPCRPGERLLDLGADLTWSTCQFARRGFACVAVDINHHLGVGRLFQNHFAVGYHLVRADMTRVPFRDGAFDVVTAVNALHHGARLDLLARNVSRMLGDGGRLAFVEPYCASQAEKLSFGRAQAAAGISEQTYLLQEWHQAFRREGLAVQSTRVADSFSAVYRKVGVAQPTGADGLDELFSGFYAGGLSLAGEPRGDIHAGALLEIPLRIENRGNGHWSPASRFPVYASYHLLRREPREGEQLVTFDNPRTPLPAELRPGESVTVGLRVTAPSEPGHYLADIDLVHEYVSWFAPHGLRGPRVPFRVTP